MRLQNQKYIITSTVETMPALDHFDIVLNPNETKTDDFYRTRVFNVQFADSSATSIALIDFLCADYEPCAVLEDDLLTVILFQSIVRIDLSSRSIAERIDCGNMGGLHEIHPIENGYIIWGEGDIFRYDRNLNRIWHFMGRDILVSLKADQHFWIDDDIIHCRDFMGWHYLLNLDGQLLENFKEFDDD